MQEGRILKWNTWRSRSGWEE